MLSALRPFNLALAFLLELAMLAAFAGWGIYTGQSVPGKIGLGIGIPLVVSVIWGLFMAPRSSTRLRGAAYLALKLVLFGLAVAALVAAGYKTLGIVLGALVLLNTVMTKEVSLPGPPG